MKITATNRQRLAWLIVTVLLVLSSPWLLTGCFPRSPLNCWLHEVDIQSGRIRYSRYLLFIKVWQKIENSPLTEALQTEDYASAQPVWGRVNTFSPGFNRSPHHNFHGALYQITMLQAAWEAGQFTRAARRASAKQLLHWWQVSGSYAGADDYIVGLVEFAVAERERNRTVDESDLPR